MAVPDKGLSHILPASHSEEKAMMKNIVLVALLATMASSIGIAACGGDSQPAKSPESASSAAPAEAPASSAAPASSK